MTSTNIKIVAIHFQSTNQSFQLYLLKYKSYSINYSAVKSTIFPSNVVEYEVA